MFENEAKGSFGCFSGAGRSSAEKYKLIAYKDQILAGKNIGATKVDAFDQRDEPVEDYLDIFGIDYDEKKQEFPRRFKKCQSTKPASERYKYYNKHVNDAKKQKKIIGPTCTKYNPKKDYTWNRSISGPLWRAQSAKKYQVRQDDSQYYLNHEDITANKVGNSLIDMSKMTMRGEFRDIRDLRIKNIKPFQTNKSCENLTSSRTNMDSRNSTTKQASTSAFFNQDILKRSLSNSQPLLRKKKKSETDRPNSSVVANLNKSRKQQTNTNTSSLEDSYEEYKHIYQKQFKKRSQSANLGKQRSKNNKIKAPDFKKAITREHLNRLSDNKCTLIPFSLPNFKHVRERPIMMVVYDLKRHKKQKRKEPVKGVDPNIEYNPDKYIHRINNHSISSPPNFNLMSSRSIDKDPLPSYMKKIYTRAAGYETTDLTLKMNNYANSKFATQFSSFCPKKTFNKIINLNLLNSNKYLNNFMWKPEKIDEANKANDYISKSMKFYRKIFYIIL